MVVRDRHTGSWMMPGGRVDRGESPEAGGRRELFEEAGVRAGHLERLSNDNGVMLYGTRVHVPRTRSARMRSFARRGTPHETSDYGFVDPTKARMTVTDYHGNPKWNGQALRRGTASQLRTVARRRSSRRRLRR